MYNNKVVKCKAQNSYDYGYLDNYAQKRKQKKLCDFLGLTNTIAGPNQ